MSLIRDLLARPDSLSAGSRFTISCGLFYLATGGLMLAWPGMVQTLFRDPPFSGHEAELVRVTGMLLGIVGWFYVMGGRTGSRPFVAATIPGRLIVVPLVLVPLGLSGVFPHLLFTFAALDPVLAIVAWVLLGRDGAAALSRA